MKDTYSIYFWSIAILLGAWAEIYDTGKIIQKTMSLNHEQAFPRSAVYGIANLNMVLCQANCFIAASNPALKTL